ncbi:MULTISPECIES: DUF6624 domain-containing protein [unclassified Duganella]|uniref:DUF6624 domain-containing protein n=1 Tax=unclassified Duganella TaxID=2636909 RepID=UPI000E3499C9|nr:MULTISPECIES: DUF6624 domain-containing protein [unclassified Duganella]RFP13766.1 hypothetical protein D0T23_15305 [Duganella sp. BJB475]RFP36474.1 hypothetical protein D0T21_08660 [Duganella sp. BJB476]
MPCPGAIAWNEAHPEQSDAAMAQRDAARQFGDPALRTELAERYTRDQDARIAWLAAPSNAGLRRRVGEIDADNVAWLSKMVRGKGFPTAAQVGEQGVLHVWLLVQHADREPKFQAALLPMLEQRHAEGELSGMNLSRSVDRVLVAQGKAQRYGTQFPTEAWASGHFGLPDEARVREVDQHRQELGIMPLADYVCMMSHARRPRP